MTELKKKQQHNNRSLQSIILYNGLWSREKFNKEIAKLNQYQRSNRPDICRHFHPTAEKYNFSKCTQNTLQDRSCIRLQNEPYQIYKDETHTKYLFQPQWNKSRNQQKEKWKSHIYVEIKTRLKNLMDKRRNHKRYQKIS